MKKSSVVLSAAITSAIAISGAQAEAEKKSKPKRIKCFGVAKAGEGSCGNHLVGLLPDGHEHKTAEHSCAGQAEVNYHLAEWKKMTAEECKEKGGKTEEEAEAELKKGNAINQDAKAMAQGEEVVHADEAKAEGFFDRIKKALGM